MNKFSSRDMARIAICVAITAICSWISIPFAIPFTLQTFAVFLNLQLLGGRNGTISIIIFILLGAIGIPVFSGFTGGLSIILGSTGGYIVGFIVIGLLYWILEPLILNNSWYVFPILFIGLIICYALGTIWFIVVYTKSSGPIGLLTVLTWCVFPFVIPDIIKLILSVFISKRIKHIKEI